MEAVFPTAGWDTVEVFLPVWTPGSYLVREYARNLEGVAGVKSRKNRWLIETGGAAEVTVNYRVYCHEMSVRTNWVEAEFALLNGAPSFITLADGVRRAHEVRLELPEEWKTCVTALPEVPGPAAHCYAAADYDTLVDSPMLLGNADIQTFEVHGVAHRFVNQSEERVWDLPRSVAAVEKIVREHLALWGSLPYDKFVIFNLMTEARGGLEHASSMCIMTSRWATSTRAAYTDWLALISHEFFHVWNIKRLRPVELGPFDYEQEATTRSLWIAEGITDYYGPLMVHRAGLTTRAEYLETLSGVLRTLQNTPGRLVQSAEQASYDAWIKLYRPDENTLNTSISYYVKGAVVGWLLDARIRRATQGGKTLDDLMRLAFACYSGDRGFTTEEFKAMAAEVAGEPFTEFFHGAVEAAGELDYSEALEWFGLRFRPATACSGKAWTGAETKSDNGRLTVSRVPRGTPAFHSGLSTEDEILAIDDFRVRADQLTQRLEMYRPGDKVSVLIARREKLVRVEVILGETPAAGWQLEVNPGTGSAERARLEAWLGR